jgi:serine/threonine-protein kinase
MYDIGDADGRPFLTMEYVDGEDLASLLRRIGRFPQDKAIEVARQICAGLSAAHERGVLHRDLKPANVMIDGDGHARITDFGLAAVAGSVDDIRSGTPAYMAPEQLAGREVTSRSDIYALGLVLFELFTGKRVFEANTLNDLIRLHESGNVATPSSVVRDLDPTIERAILRCLEREPANRPASALAVSAALPGGDQLAAALAAGETPSPEMVAAAGEQSALRPIVGLGLLAFTLIMLAGLAAASQRYSIVHRIPMPRSIDWLNDRGQEILERLGYEDRPFSSAHGWAFSRDYFAYSARAGGRVPSDAWPELSSGRTGTLTFWYRTFPISVLAQNYVPNPNDPPRTLPGMRFVRLDPAGRLLEFDSVPPRYEADSAPGRAPDWAPLFESAALAMSTFHPVESRWLPPHHSDVRAAWEGPYPDVPGATARVEAAAYRGRPMYFNVIGPWTGPPAVPSPQTRTTGQLIITLSIVIAVLIVAAATLLARRHWRTGRADLRGAFRTAALVFATQSAGFLIRARHYSAVEFEYLRVSELLASTLFSAVGLWVLYMAFEPYVRRFWPQLLIGWSRLLSGHVRDPLVGRDVLVGAAAGTIAALLIASREIIPHVLHRAVQTPQVPAPLILLGIRYALDGALETVLRALRNALQVVCVVVFLRILVRQTWLVLLIGTVAIMPIAMSGMFAAEQLAIELSITVAGILLVFGVLLRFGLLALAVTFYTFLMMEVFPLTTDFSRPYAGTSIVLLLAIAAVAAYGFYASRGDEPLFGRPLLD